MTDQQTDEQNTPDLVVKRNDAANRYELHLDGTVAGYLEYTVSEGGALVLPHTVIEREFGGRGLGTTLVAESLEDMARRGETVVPECPFVVKYLKENDVAGLIVDWPADADAQDSATPGEQPG